MFLPLYSLCQISGKIEFGTEYLKMAIDTSTISDEKVKDYMVQYESNAKMALSSEQTYYYVKFNAKGALTVNIPIMASPNSLKPTDFDAVSEYLVLNQVGFAKRLLTKDYVYVKTPDVYVEWKITNETKSILGYQCRKAITFYNGEKIKNKEPIVAWFTDQIPASYGPYRYHGLPGFILELNELGRRHYARKITLNEKNIELDFPPKDLLLTEEEYKSFFK